MNELSELFSLNFEAYLQGSGLVAALVGMGLIVGVTTGLFGVGGAFLVNPFLIVLLGIPETLVVGSGLSFTIGTGAAGTARHWRMKHVDAKTALWLVAGALPCVMLGKLLHEGLRDALGPEFFPALFRLFYLLVLLVTGWIILRAPFGPEGRKSILQRMGLGPHVDLCKGKIKGISLPGLLLVGGSIGLIKGLLGIGGGVLFVPLLLMAVGLRIHMAVGTSLAVVVLSSIFGTALYGQSGQVNMLLVMSLLLGSVVGIQLGSWMCRQLHAEKLQRSFGYVVLLAAVLVGVDLVLKLAKG